MLQQITVQLGGFPINLICVSNGTIGFMPAGVIGSIYTSPEGELLGSIITDESIKVFDKKQEKIYTYGTAYEYKQDALLLKWLVEQSLVTPQF